MPNRRTFEMVVITVILLHPALSLVRVWAQKHIATTGNESTAHGASAVAELF